MIVGPTLLLEKQLTCDRLLANASMVRLSVAIVQQVYHKLDIGTAKATTEEQAGSHHLIDVREVTESYSAF